MDRPKSRLLLILFIVMQLFTLPPMLMLFLWVTQVATDIVLRSRSLIHHLAKHAPQREIDFDIQGFYYWWELKLFIVIAFALGLGLFILSYRDYMAGKRRWMLWQGILLGFTGIMIWNLITLITSMGLLH